MRDPSVRSVSLSLQKGRDATRRWLAPGEVSPNWNKWNLYRDIAWYGVISGVSGTFTGVFALRLGGSNFLIGLLTSLPALVNVLFQIPAARLIERRRNTRSVILWSGFFMRLPVFLVALVPLFFGRFQADAVVYITALGTIPAALSNVAFTVMLADVVAPADRAHVVSVRNVLFSAVTTVAVIVAGKALDIINFPLSYQLIFSLSFLASLVSLYYVGRVAIPDRVPASQTAAGGERVESRPALRTMLAQRGFVRFTLATFLFHWGLYLPIPLYTIYRVRVLDISDGWIGTLSMIETSVTVVTWYIWGKVAEKRGSRFVLLLGALGVCLYPFGTALSTSVYPMLVVVAIAGIVSPGWGLGLFNGLLEVAPADHRATYVAVFNTLMNLTACVAPILGITLAGSLGIRPALLIGGVLRLLGFVAFVVLLRIPSGQPRLSAKGSN